MPILSLHSMPDFSARSLMMIADQVINEEKKYGYLSEADIPILIMKGILRWEEIRATDPDFGVLKESNESKESNTIPEAGK